MEISMENELHDIDSRIIGLYTMLESNRDRSMKELELAIKSVEQEVVAGNPKLYKFQCCDRDYKINKRIKKK